jgi:hypothetical protein
VIRHADHVAPLSAKVGNNFADKRTQTTGFVFFLSVIFLFSGGKWLCCLSRFLSHEYSVLRFLADGWLRPLASSDRQFHVWSFHVSEPLLSPLFQHVIFLDFIAIKTSDTNYEAPHYTILHIRVLFCFRSRGSAVDKASRYVFDDRWAGVRIPIGSRMFTSPYRPDRLWCLLNSYGGSFANSRAAGAWSWPLKYN